MSQEIKVREIECASAIGKCNFPGGGFAINPYVGCAHNCRYCYARFIKRFTGHAEPWGSFVDVRVNIAGVLEKQLRSKKYSNLQIYIGTVTDPYQPLEEKYRLTRNILETLLNHQNPISILTKSDLVLRAVSWCAAVTPGSSPRPTSFACRGRSNARRTRDRTPIVSRHRTVRRCRSRWRQR